MALPLPKKAKKVNTSYILPKDGVYRIVIEQAQDKVDDFENSKRKGNHYYNLRISYDNNKNRFERVDYLNKEGDKEPLGYNFILAMKEIAQVATEIPKPLREELETQDTDSDKVFDLLVQYKVPFYAAFRNTKSQTTGDTYTNLNNYFEPFYLLDEEMLEEIKSRKIELVELEKPEEEEENENPYLENQENSNEDEDGDW